MCQNKDIFEEIISAEDVTKTFEVEQYGTPVTFILYIYSYAAKYWKRVIECMIMTLSRQRVDLTVEEDSFENHNKDVFMRCRLDMRRLDMHSMWKLLQTLQQNGPIGYVDVCGTRISDAATNTMEMTPEGLALCAEFMYYTFSSIKHKTWEDCVKFISDKASVRESFPLTCCNMFLALEEKLHNTSPVCSMTKGRSLHKNFLKNDMVRIYCQKIDFSERYLSVFKKDSFEKYVKEHIEEFPVQQAFYCNHNSSIRSYFFYLGYIISDDGQGGFVTIIYQNTNINRTLGEFKGLLFGKWE